MNHENIIDSGVVSVLREEEEEEELVAPYYRSTNKSIPQHIWGDYDNNNDSLTEESSIDFSALEDELPLFLRHNNNYYKGNNNNIRRRQKNLCSVGGGDMLNDCSNADTISTANESSSWGGESSTLSTSRLLVCDYCNDGDHDDDDDDDDDDDNSESSLTLDDLKAYFMEDQVGIYNPTRDDIPPPKARTYYKGDSQNSFSLDDLVDMEEADDEQDDETNNEDNEDSLGCLQGPSSSSSSRRQSQRSRRRSSRRRKSKRKSRQSLFLEEEEEHLTFPPLKGILKNGKCNTRRSSSLTMLMMEDSSMFRLSCGYNDNDNDNKSKESSMENGWGLLQQSFCLEEEEEQDDIACLDLQALLETKKVTFSSVVVHSHPVVVGDNPSVSEGVPLMLDWTAQDTATYNSLEDYEDTKRTTISEEQQVPAGEPTSPTTTAVCKLDAEERMFRLLNSGASLQDIQEAEAMVNKTREEREATRQSNLLGTTGHRTVFWRVIQKDVEESEEPELLPAATATRSTTRRN